jgi:hypothetical protein
MVREPLKNWLSAVFGLPIVEDMEQTKVEQSIGYDLATSPIKIRYQDGGGEVVFDFPVTIIYRCPNGYQGIGFLSVKLADKSKQIDGFQLQSTEGAEVVNYQTKTEMIITKTVHARVIIEYNKVREIIKQVNLTET